MLKRFWPYLLVGLAVMAVLLSIGLWSNRGSQIRLNASVLKTRLVATEPNAAVAILEVRVENPANYPFIPAEIEIAVLDGQGAATPGMVVSEMDLDRVLSYYKDAGPRYNPTLKFKEKIPPRSTADRTVAAQFPLPEKTLAARRGWRISIKDLDGAVVEIAEKR
jgi:hypothetical protein